MTFFVKLEVPYGKHVKFTKKGGEILSSFTENTSYCSDVTIYGGKLSRVGELSIAERLQGRYKNPSARVGPQMVDHFLSFSVLLHYKRNLRSMRSTEF